MRCSEGHSKDAGGRLPGNLVEHFAESFEPAVGFLVVAQHGHAVGVQTPSDQSGRGLLLQQPHPRTLPKGESGNLKNPQSPGGSGFRAPQDRCGTVVLAAELRRSNVLSERCLLVVATRSSPPENPTTCGRRDRVARQRPHSSAATFPDGLWGHKLDPAGLDRTSWSHSWQADLQDGCALAYADSTRDDRLT